MKIRIGSRKSELALLQANFVKSQIEAFVDCEIVTFDTKGDLILDRALHKIGDKGLFTAELEKALLENYIELAVHSLKDLPTKANPELPIAAITARKSAFDSLVFSERFQHLSSFLELPPQSIIGTSSLRRVLQLKHLRPDFQFISLRGNIGTRLQKIHNEDAGVVCGVLAEAGLIRLNKQNQIHQVLSVEQCIPAAGQGALAIQVNANKLAESPELQQALFLLNDVKTSILVGAERTALEAINGGCQTPFGAYAEFISEEQIKLKIVLGDENCQKISFAETITQANTSLEDAKQLGLNLKTKI
jgi:hydroxymethylbilane synthase